mgnify:CR=1 FL=1
MMWGRNRGMDSARKLFLRLLVPNLLCLILPLLVGYVIYEKTLHEMEREVTASNMNLLEQTRDIMDRRFQELNSIAMQMVHDTRIMHFQRITDPFEGANTYRIWETRKSIRNFSLTNNFIFDYFILYKNSELVLTEYSTYELSEFFRYFQYRHMDQKSWEQLLASEYHRFKVLPAQDVTINGVTYSLLTYIQSLGYPGYPQGLIAITVDNREIQKLLGKHDLSGGGHAYIFDRNGSVISSTSADLGAPIDPGMLKGEKGSLLQTFEDQNMIVTYTTSKVNGWVYLVIQPEYVVLEKVLYVKKITFLMAFIFLATGLLIACFIAYKNSRPFKNIMETNRELQEKIKKQSPLLQAALFERLLKWDFASSKDIPVLLQHAGIEMQGEYFIAAILQLRGYDGGLGPNELKELDIWRVRIKDILKLEMPGNSYWHDVAEDQIVLMFVLRPRDFADTSEMVRYVEGVVQKISERIRAKLNLCARFAVGGLYANLDSVSRSYEEAKRTLEYMLWTNRNGTMRFDELPSENHTYYFPSDLEVRLGHLTKAGEQEAVGILLEELYHINFVERNLSLPMLQIFVNEVWGNLIKIIPQVAVEGEEALAWINPYDGETARYAPSYEVLAKNYQFIVSRYREVCKYVNEHKKSQNVELLEKVTALLHASYAQSHVSLDFVAEQLGISKGYLSQFFKEQTGVNFSDYLEDLRMTRAKELLAETDMPIHEIAERVGYNSSNTFCRAFKRINGVSASAFRQANIV